MMSNGKAISAESQRTVRITGQRRIGAAAYLLRFNSAAIARTARPGQFIHLRLPDGTPLLRRPFSIHDVSDDTVSILYRVGGAGTRLLARLDKGQQLDVIGPLGQPFKIEQGQHHHIVLAGGIGIAPLQFLLRRLRAARLSPRLFYGCRTRAEILPHLDVNKVTATDDGSCGTKGFITAALERQIARHPGARIYACGPWPMLREAARIAAKHGLSCQVSLESYMACGVGACQGCVVRTVDGYRTVCHDGPVFDSATIDWDQEPPI